MKKIVNAIIYCALFISCTNSLSDNKLSEYDIKTQAIEIIEQGYISFQDNQYHLDLDINKAIDLGYSSFTYSKLQATIDEANNIIRTQLNEWQNDPNISEIRISDATYDKNTLDFRMTKSPTMYGTIETIDASPREQTYTLPPVQASHIIANCYARNYPFGVNMVTTIQSGIVECKSTMNSNNIQVAIKYTGTNLTVRYQTTCSGGGICTWKLPITGSEIYLP